MPNTCTLFDVLAGIRHLVTDLSPAISFSTGGRGASASKDSGDMYRINSFAVGENLASLELMIKAGQSTPLTPDDYRKLWWTSLNPTPIQDPLPGGFSMAYPMLVAIPTLRPTEANAIGRDCISSRQVALMLIDTVQGDNVTERLAVTEACMTLLKGLGNLTELLKSHDVDQDNVLVIDEYKGDTLMLSQSKFQPILRIDKQVDQFNNLIDNTVVVGTRFTCRVKYPTVTTGRHPSMSGLAEVNKR
jgi:hypothetical protein